MLAAGLSSRMGKWKLVMPWGTGTILDSALESALSFCDRVILVTGFRGDELAAYYQAHPAIDVIHHSAYRAGMFSSIQHGVAAVRAGHFFIALGDMPEVTPDVYGALWQHRSRESCVIPRYDRGKGHPVLLPARAIPMITNAAEGTTLKDIIGQMPTRIAPVSGPGIHWDVDTPEQYQQLAGLTLQQ